MNDSCDNFHRRVVEILSERYQGPLIENKERGVYVEAMIAEILGTKWELTYRLPGYGTWSEWDIENRTTGKRIEIKQSAACQTWHSGTNVATKPVFSIKEAEGYFGPDHGEMDSGWTQFESPTRLADLYIFAWHGVGCENNPDHRDRAQWEFYVVSARDLPKGQKSIGLQPLKEFAYPTDYRQLIMVVEMALSKN